MFLLKIKKILLPKTLFGRLIILPSLAIIVSFIIIFVIVGYTQYHYLKTNIEHNSKVIMKEIFASLEKYLLLDDYAEIESIMRRFSLIESIESISLINAQNIPLIEIKKDKNQEIQTSYNSPNRYKIIHSSNNMLISTKERLHSYILYAPIIKAKELWYIRLEINKDYSYSKVLNLFIFGTFLALLFIVLVSTIIYFIINRPLKDIKALTHFSWELDKRIGEQTYIVTPIREINDLTESLNRLSNKLYKNQIIMNEQYVALEEFNEKLSLKVEEEVIKNREKDIILFKNSRLITLAEMIGNIAHQWRQPLNSIALLAQSLEMMYELDELSKEDFHNDITEIMLQVNYLSQTIDDFRELVKENKSDEPFEVSNVIMQTHKLIKPALNNVGIHIYLELEKNITLHFGNAQIFSQALLNLLNNAKDALLMKDESYQKEIHVRLKQSLQSIKLIVCDNGGGLDETIVEKIFDPYFTTKSKSNGTGLGLSIAKSIVEKDFCGRLYAYNNDKGACFVMEFVQQQPLSSL